MPAREPTPFARSTEHSEAASRTVATERSRSTLRLRRISRGTGEVQANGDLVFDFHLSGHEEDASDSVGQLDSDVECFSGTHHAAELDVVDARGDGDFARFENGHFGDHDCSRLHRGFEQQHAGKDGELRIVPGKDRQVGRQEFLGTNFLVREFGDFIEP